MFEKCKSLIIKVKTNAEGKVLVTNFISLSILQLLNLLLPLITLPYLVKVIGAEKFGVIAFASSMIVYFQAITDYGFSLSGTRQISHNREVNSELSKIFSRIISIKMLLMIVSFIIFLIIISFFDKFKNDKEVFLLSFITLVGNVFFPEWFFQGIEKMKFITFFNFVSKMLFTISLFIFITEKSDYIFVPLITSLGFLIAGLVAFFYAIIKFQINFVLPSFKEMRLEVKNGFNVFISLFLPNLYYNSSTFFLGLFSNNISVALFSAAQRVISLGISLIEVFSRTFYPYLNRKIHKHDTFEKLILILGLMISIGIAIFSKLIISLLFSEEFTESIYLLLILSISPFLNAMMFCYGTNYLLPKNQDKVLMRIILIVSIFGFFMTILMVRLFSHWGAAINLIIVWSLRSILTYSAARKIKMLN